MTTRKIVRTKADNRRIQRARERNAKNTAKEKADAKHGKTRGNLPPDVWSEIVAMFLGQSRKARTRFIDSFETTEDCIQSVRFLLREKSKADADAVWLAAMKVAENKGIDTRSIDGAWAKADRNPGRRLVTVGGGVTECLSNKGVRDHGVVHCRPKKKGA